MTFIADKVIMLLLSGLSIGMIRNAEGLLVAFLIVVLYISVNSLFESKKICGITSVVYFMLMLVIPSLFIFVPVIFLELIINEMFPYMLMMVIPFGIFLGYSLPIKSGISCIVLMAVAWYMVENSKKKSILQQMVNKVRDDSEEKKNLLEKSNRNLIEKQNYEIYAATLKERNRIAREIHDNVGHVITRSILQMGALMTINKEEPLHSQLEAVKDNLDIAMNSIRESVHDLHDESIDMKQAIDDIVKELEKKFNVKYDYDIGIDIERNFKYAIIGVVKEATSNAIKHSENSDIIVTLREHPGMYQIIVHDYNSHSVKRNNDNNKDVYKSNDSSKVSDGIGLQNINDRISALNGVVRISRDDGFKVFISIPKKMK